MDYGIWSRYRSQVLHTWSNMFLKMIQSQLITTSWMAEEATVVLFLIREKDGEQEIGDG
jgi:hypothetical protein